MSYEKRIVTFQGNPLTLLGNPVKVGNEAPNFHVIANNLHPMDFASFKGKTCIISAVPSLDTPVCDRETRRFNEEAVKFHENVEILTISMDLPFAQGRWCAAAGIDRVQTFSDHRDASFGMSYGVLIKELRLLSRIVFIVDRNGIIRLIHPVTEITQEPDYTEIIASLQDIIH